MLDHYLNMEKLQSKASTNYVKRKTCFGEAWAFSL